MLQKKGFIKSRGNLFRNWLSRIVQNPIQKKNRLFKKFVKHKNPNTKPKHHDEYKQYRNCLSTLIKESKQKYFNNYFQNNVNNIKNTSKGIKWIISLKAKDSEIPKIIKTEHGETFTDPKLIADNFNSFFLISSPISPRKN